MATKTLLLLLVAMLAFAAPSRASDVIWSALVKATNETVPLPPPGQLAPFTSRLQSVFGYNQFTLISEQTREIEDDAEQWLLPGRNYSLLINAKPAGNSIHRLKMQLFQEKRLLVKTQTELSRDNPLFIKGPLCGRGQLVIILMVR